MSPKIVITGYTYTRENLFDVFEKYPERENLYFILPGNWTAKGGKVRFAPFEREDFAISRSPAFFTHSHYPLIGGLLKGWMPFFVFRLVALRLRGANVLYTAGEPNLLSTLYNALFAKLLGMKHVFLYWENIPYERKDTGVKLLLKRGIVRMNVALADGAICGMSKAAAILRTFSTTLPIGTFLHAGFDIGRFRPGVPSDIRGRLGIGDRFLFLYVGALGYRKGIRHALRALARLKREGADARLLIVGSGEYERELRELSDGLGLGGDVSWLPWLANEELPGLYSASDAFLYPSFPHEGWEEQFGYSIGEASLCGVPVISTRSGSIDEVMQDGITGLMVAPDDEDALTGAMRTLMDDPAMRTRMGTAGRSFVAGRFSNDVIARKLYDLFSGISSFRSV